MRRREMSDPICLALICEAIRYCQRATELGMPMGCITKALREPIFFLFETKNLPKDRAARYRSRGSLGVGRGTGELVYDHAIPFGILQSELLALGTVTPEAVLPLLRSLTIAVLITKEEDAILRAAGLGTKMPAGWDGIDVTARYKAAGIELVDNSD